MTYFRLLRKEWQLLFFGLSFTCLSGFGQTFFIAIFGAEIRAEFDLTHAGFGTIYAIATFASAVSIIWIGKLIDHVDLRLYAAMICLGMVASCFLMSFAATAAMLCFALFMLRLTGQGLMGHTSMTSMARYIPEARGKATGFSSTGHQLSEVLLPVPAVFLIAEFGWRQSWTGFGLLVLFVILPWLMWLLRGHTQRHNAYIQRMNEEDTANAAEDAAEAAALKADPAAPRRRRKNWTRAQVLSDWRFYLMLPAVTAPAFICTGIFFHQAALVEEKGWNMAWFAMTIGGFAAAGFVMAVISGALVDRLGSFKILPFYLLPMAAGLALVSAFDAPAVALALMVLLGMSNGTAVAVFGSLWPELYGTRHLGAIRSALVAMLVLMSAATPPLMGVLIDGGITVSQISAGFSAYILLTIALIVTGASFYKKDMSATVNHPRPSAAK